MDTSSTAYHVGEFTGLVVVLVLGVYVLRRALTHGFGGTPGRGRNALLAIVAVLAVGAYVVSAVDRGLFDGGASASGSSAGSGWSSPSGIEVRAGFMAGCSGGVASRYRVCECIFARLHVAPGYNTPAGFEELVTAKRRLSETRAVVAAVYGCAGKPIPHS